ncbi:MAG: phage integrase SAM-like domain-containing protein, partial [Candidatus Symbiothrix sp.]|nr:phage integrase SAM-like domain-containing protein [Candidatus Symbiothrix sp.]
MSKIQRKKELAQAIAYTPPKLYTGKEWYVGFYAYEPVKEKLCIKRIKLNYIDNKNERRKFACDLIKRLNDKLRRGWNPWIAAEVSKGYCTFKETCEHYDRIITKKFSDGYYRDDTYTSYLSYLRRLKEYNENYKFSIHYIYQLDKQYIIDFLEYVYVDKDNSARTRDNYLGWLKSFATFLVQSGYAKEKATEGIDTFSKWQKKKKREYLPEDILMKVKKEIEGKNNHFLLATYILFYTFIRPSEMSKLKISNINIKNRTIIIGEDQS